MGDSLAAVFLVALTALAVVFLVVDFFISSSCKKLITLFYIILGMRGKQFAVSLKRLGDFR